jgi:hypothetical protein
MEDDRDLVNYPYGNPSVEFAKYRHLNKSQDIEDLDDVSNRDLLVAILYSADAIWFELRRIREATEKRKG